MTNSEIIEEAQTNQPEKQGIDDGPYWLFEREVDKLNQRVANGEISTEEADELYKQLKEDPVERRKKWNKEVAKDEAGWVDQQAKKEN
jgi:hypothetical protein